MKDRFLGEFINLPILWTVPECLLCTGWLLAIQREIRHCVDTEVHGPEKDIDKHLIHCTQYMGSTGRGNSTKGIMLTFGRRGFFSF